MTLYLIAFIGGVLTIVSPCILPVLPFVFTSAGRSFRQHGLPLLIGMAMTFTAVASLATVAGEWVVRANQLGRAVALVVFGVLGVALVAPVIAEWLTRPLVRLGAAMQSSTGATTYGGSLLLGASTGFLWAPCAGPILGLILAGAALQGPSASSAFLLLSFASGAACALAVVLLAGNRLLQRMRSAVRVEEWVRRSVGVAVLAGVFAIAMGWDTGLLARLSLSTFGTAAGLEQQLVDRVSPPENEPAMAMAPAMMMMEGASSSAAKAPAEMPPLDGAVQWLNGPPQTRDGLRGKVVLIDFWTYSCINCLRALPYVQAWDRKYRSQGLVVIGVHSPEFAFERDVDNVAGAARDLQLSYPIAIDSNRVIWTAFANRFWPAHYVVDRQGRVRYRHFGEGKYDQTERVIQSLLAGDGQDGEGDVVSVAATGVQAAPDLEAIQSPETYLGYDRLENYASTETIVRDRATRYSAPRSPALNQWGLEGEWTVGAEEASLAKAGGRVLFRFHARDLHLVLAPGSDGKPVRFRVTLDGAAPGDARGVDVDAGGNGVVTGSRLYQLIRQRDEIEERTFAIEFLDPGVHAFAFTFG